MKFFLILFGTVILHLLTLVSGSSTSWERSAVARGGGGSASKIAYAKKAGGRSSPLDINNEVAGSLGTLNSLVGTLGHSSSTAVMGLAGVSITDCAGQLPKDKELSKLPCDEFLDALSECDSMANVKPQLQEAKKNYNKHPNKKAPCFKNKKKSKSKKH